MGLLEVTSAATLVTLVGPSGAGKTTLARALQAAGVKRIPTTTTRSARQDEIVGRDLHVVSAQHFARLRFLNSIIATCDYSNASYGVQVEHLVAAAATALTHVIIVEPSGIPSLRSWAGAAGMRFTALFVTSTPDAIRERLETRYAREYGRVNERDDRLARALEEASAWRNACAWDLILESGCTQHDLESVLDFLARPIEPADTFAACA